MWIIVIGPKQRMGAGPEVVGEVVSVCGHHGLDAAVEDCKCVVRPEVTANVGEVLIFEEQTVAKISIEDEVGLDDISVSVFKFEMMEHGDIPVG
jgi:hypothetical protein